MRVFQLALALTFILFNSSLFSMDGEDREVKRPTLPLIFTVSKGDIEFDVMGAMHTFPYERLDPSAQAFIERRDILVLETDGGEEDYAKIYKEKYPVTPNDKELFDKLFASQYYTSRDEETRRAFERVREYGFNFAATLDFFGHTQNKKYTSKAMDSVAKDKFKAAGKEVLGLVKADTQAQSGPDSSTGDVVNYLKEHDVKHLQESSLFWVLSGVALFFEPDNECPDYPQNIDEIRTGIQNEQAEDPRGVYMLRLRDTDFAVNSCLLAEKYLGKRLLVMPGCGHLPGMFEKYASTGWTVRERSFQPK